ETHVSTQQAQARQNARLSYSHENCRRPQRHPPPPRQRPRQTLRLRRI
ncbi:MAG: LSU ribosomal protein L34p, partial [uncultured Truepera sp.]